MSLTSDINEGIKTAMKEKDEVRLRTLRAIKSAILLEQTSKGGNEELSDEQGMKILQKLAKQRKESLEIYQAQGRPELAKTEEEELAVISTFLPKQIDEDAVREIIKNIIDEAGVIDMSQVGKVMPIAMKMLAGQADGKLISAIVKELLS